MKILLKLISVLIVLFLILESCAPKSNCGTKKQHKQRTKAAKKMAPTM